MEDIDVSVLVRDGNIGSRKRQAKESSSSLRKKKLYSKPRNSNTFIPCAHNSKSFQCGKFTPPDAMEIRNRIYSVPDKIRQDRLVSNLLTLKNVVRRRQRPNRKNAPKPRLFNVNYKVPRRDGKSIHVCKKFFLHIVQIKPTHLNSICKKIYQVVDIKENRGGDRKSHLSEDKKNSVRKYIGSLPAYESHYSRNKSKRLYLRSDLNVKKLHKAYNNSMTDTDNNLRVSLAMFRRVFNKDFNLGFKTPATDVCSYCERTKNLIINATGEAKVNLLIQLRIHKKRAQAFYELMKEEHDDDIIFCFDMQQVQQLPKTAIQEAYYARQLSFYNLCITDVKNAHPTFYTWTEEQAGRGSTEVSSALLNFLGTCDFNGKKVLKLFCDGCGGQNKNNFVIHTLMYFLSVHQGPIEEIIITFPIRGHSFLPADRVFGRLEKLLRRKTTMVTKEEYYEMYQEVGTVMKLGTDWTLKDIKSISTHLKNIENISNKKRIFIKRIPATSGKTNIKVKANENFRFEHVHEKYISLLKRGQQWGSDSFVLEDKQLGHIISDLKKKDINDLLAAMFGGEWREREHLNFYKTIIDDENLVPIDNNDDVVECDCLEDDCCAIHT